MSGIAERLAEVLRAALQDRANRPTGYDYLAPYLTQALLPVVEREIAVARGEVVARVEAVCVELEREDPMHVWGEHGKSQAAWRVRAALSPDPDRGEGVA